MHKILYKKVGLYRASHKLKRHFANEKTLLGKANLKIVLFQCLRYMRLKLLNDQQRNIAVSVVETINFSLIFSIKIYFFMKFYKTRGKKLQKLRKNFLEITEITKKSQKLLRNHRYHYHRNHRAQISQ